MEKINSYALRNWRCSTLVLHLICGFVILTHPHPSPLSKYFIHSLNHIIPVWSLDGIFDKGNTLSTYRENNMFLVHNMFPEHNTLWGHNMILEHNMFQEHSISQEHNTGWNIVVLAWNRVLACNMALVWAQTQPQCTREK